MSSSHASSYSDAPLSVPMHHKFSVMEYLEDDKIGPYKAIRCPTLTTFWNPSITTCFCSQMMLAGFILRKDAYKDDEMLKWLWWTPDRSKDFWADNGSRYVVGQIRTIFVDKFIAIADYLITRVQKSHDARHPGKPLSDYPTYDFVNTLSTSLEILKNYPLPWKFCLFEVADFQPVVLDIYGHQEYVEKAMRVEKPPPELLHTSLGVSTMIITWFRCSFNTESLSSTSAMSIWHCQP
ncbi:hypothetical protein BJ138DRAFT_1105315 [Hygrophoropsis aurantiaca]|uniref:Uncharacterized protein n=1 Tax=Hygrophoropsis aurantiaca TaxID=72124 RepID=A0ACB7ZYR4_9AGAM|nr:hypothetical protein BJ138DRAFT_1105315 [Hygrophoropsis aurantiaca]